MYATSNGSMMAVHRTHATMKFSKAALTRLSGWITTRSQPLGFRSARENVFGSHAVGGGRSCSARWWSMSWMLAAVKVSPDDVLSGVPHS